MPESIVISCLVIQLNEHQFITDDNNIVGKIENVPCEDVIIDENEFWMVPMRQDGFFTHLQPFVAIGDYASKPTPESFKVVRVRHTQNKIGYTYWIYGTKDQFLTACRTKNGFSCYANAFKFQFACSPHVIQFVLKMKMEILFRSLPFLILPQAKNISRLAHIIIMDYFLGPQVDMQQRLLY